MIPPAASFFLLRECNLRCKFCFATFRDVAGRLSLADALRVVDALAEGGVEKLTLVGGEPTLHLHIGRILRHAHDIGMTTCIVTNGARLLPLLDTQRDTIDWVGLSADSGDETTQQALGRGNGDHVAQTVRLARACHEAGVRVKLNTVVTQLGAEEDMSAFVRAVTPHRWKVFQVLPVAGQNDRKVEPLLISDASFRRWVERHAPLNPVVESNRLMRGSYVLVDPLGRFFSNATGKHVYSEPILDVGASSAWQDVSFLEPEFIERGGLYDWGPGLMTLPGSSIAE